MKIVERLATVHFVSPFLPRPLTGDESTRWVCQGLDALYIRYGFVFSDSISELEMIARAAGTSVHAGLMGLKRYGYVEIEGDMFTPTQLYLDRFTSS